MQKIWILLGLLKILVGIIMLSESVLGPLWAFLFVSERPSMYGLIGGAIILFAVLIQFYSLLSKNKKSIFIISPWLNYKSGAITRLTIAMTFIKIFIEGPISKTSFMSVIQLRNFVFSAVRHNT